MSCNFYFVNKLVKEQTFYQDNESSTEKEVGNREFICNYQQHFDHIQTSYPEQTWYFMKWLAISLC